MKKLLSFTALLFSLNVNAQMGDDCTDNFTALNIGYAFPNSIVLGGDYFTKLGLVAGIGGAYTFPQKVTLKQGENTFETETNSMDIYAYVGWRIFRKDHVVSVFGNVGYTMGDMADLSPLASIKLLFPIGYKAVSLEPVYIHGRGMAAKLAIHFKL